MENKLISAEALLHALRDDADINGTNFARVKRHIENAPAVVTDNNVGSKWIPVTERLPEMERTVLVKDRVTGEVTTAHLNEFHSFVFRDGRGHGASHWMPLPEAPKGE